MTHTEVSTSLLECQENDAKMEDAVEEKNIYVNQIDTNEEVQSHQNHLAPPEEDTESTYYITPNVQPNVQPNPKGNFLVACSKGFAC